MHTDLYAIRAIYSYADIHTYIHTYILMVHKSAVMWVKEKDFGNTGS